MSNYPFAVFCPFCSKDSFILNSVFDCCGEKPACQQCDEPLRSRQRADAKFCSPACRRTFHGTFTNPRLKDCCTIAELSVRSGVSVAAIRRRIKAGLIIAHKIGSIYIVSKSALKQKPVQKPAKPVIVIAPEVAAAFRSFAKKRNLSVRQLAAVCRIGKSSAQRFLSGTAPDAYFHKIAHNLPREISAEIHN